MPDHGNGTSARLQATRTVELPVSTAWAVVSDPSRFDQWMSTHQRWRCHPPDALVVGDELHQDIDFLDRRATVVWRVQQCLSGAQFVLDGVTSSGMPIVLGASVSAIGARSLLAVRLEFTLPRAWGDEPRPSCSPIDVVDRSVENLRELICAEGSAQAG